MDPLIRNLLVISGGAFVLGFAGCAAGEWARRDMELNIEGPRQKISELFLKNANKAAAVTNVAEEREFARIREKTLRIAEVANTGIEYPLQGTGGKTLTFHYTPSGCKQAYITIPATPERPTSYRNINLGMRFCDRMERIYLPVPDSVKTPL